LIELKQKGWKHGIVSHSQLEAAMDMLRRDHIDHLFDFVISTDQVQAAKPNDKVYQAVIHTINTIDKMEIYYIASHVFDCCGASSNGFKTILVDGTVHGTERSVAEVVLGGELGGLIYCADLASVPSALDIN